MAPFYDLAANLDRFHQRDAGLVVSFATENVRLYDLALRDAWGEVSARGGTPMRPLVGKARLLLPWGGGPAELRLRGAGKLTFAVDGKKRSPVTLSAEGVRVSLGSLAAGERELTFEPKGKPALHRLELAAPEAAGCAPGSASATRGSAAASLAGMRQYEITVELPGRAGFSFTPRGGAVASVSVRGEDGERRTLWSGPANGRPITVPLDGSAPQIASLLLESPDCSTSWNELRLGALAPPRSPAKPAPVTAKHVVLLVVDTLRADRLSAIADTRVKTPRLDAALARGGFAFTAHHSSAPSSPPSHTTIHTGLLPRVHGVTGDDAQLAEGSPMLSALLSAKGFYAGYVGNNDFAMGRLKKPGKWSDHKAPVFEDKGIDCAPIIERALGLLEAPAQSAKASGKRIFLSLLPLEPHVPYRFHEGITETYYPGPYKGMLGKRVTSAHLGRIKSKGLPDAGWQQLRALYDGEITYFDSCYAALEDGLAKLGLAQDTAIILTSDHGEGMGERGNNTGHAYSLFHELTWVPLLFFGEPFAKARPGAPAGLRRYAHATSNLDLAPTILELLGEPVDPKMQGQSLLPILRGETPWPRAVATEYGKAYAIRAGRWHYVADYEGRGKLFDVSTDPASLRDRSADPTAAVPLRYLREAAASFLSGRTRWRAADGSWTNWAPRRAPKGPR